MAAAGVLRSKIEALGVGVHTGKNTQAIVDGESCRHRMQFADGSALETDIDRVLRRHPAAAMSWRAPAGSTSASAAAS